MILVIAVLSFRELFIHQFLISPTICEHAPDRPAMEVQVNITDVPSAYWPLTDPLEPIRIQYKEKWPQNRSLRNTML